MPQSTAFIGFRQAAYATMTCRADALFELSDALLLGPLHTSVADLSQAPVFRRQWESVYQALEDGGIDLDALLALYARHIPAPSTPGERLLLAVDTTTYPRVKAPTLPDRGIQHQPTAVPGAKPITVGHQYSTIAWIPQEPGSWALFLSHDRVPSSTTASEQAVAQMRAVCAVLPDRPVLLADAAYGTAPFRTATAPLAADTIVRLRSRRTLRRAPGPYGGVGRPPKHGPAFKLHDARTWGPPDDTTVVVVPTWGRVRLTLWGNLHVEEVATLPFPVVRVEPLEPGRLRHPLWLAWWGDAVPPLADWPGWYRFRFHLEHGYRFDKHTLGLCALHAATPAPVDLWSTLVGLVVWELWFARSLVRDRPLPWQKPQQDQQTGKLTPGRVRQSIGELLAAVGTPARAPQPRGIAPGWPTGKARQRRPRYAIVRKRSPTGHKRSRPVRSRSPAAR